VAATGEAAYRGPAAPYRLGGAGPLTLYNIF
jgi:hypothetical protein